MMMRGHSPSRLLMLANPQADTWSNRLPPPDLLPENLRSYFMAPDSPVQPAPMELPAALWSIPFMPVGYRR